MKYLPICIELTDRNCLVVGGGSVALRKTKRLLSAGARVLVAAPEISSELTELSRHAKVTLIRSIYQSQMITDVTLVIAATDDLSVNQRVARDAMQRHLLVNVVDQPALCNFIVPSIVDRSPLTIAISSGGSAPVLARMLREKLEWLVPESLSTVLSEVAKKRAQIAKVIPEMSKRRRFWENYFEQLLDWSTAKNIACAPQLESFQNLTPPLEPLAKQPAILSLIDLGSGKVDYLPLRTIKRLHKAEHVFIAPNIPQPVLDIVRRDAELHTVNLPTSNTENFLDRVEQNIRPTLGDAKNVCVLQLGHDFETIDISLLQQSIKPSDARLEKLKALPG